MARSCLSRLLFAAFCTLGLLAVLPRANGYVLENKSWPKGTVITMQMELGALKQTLQDGSSSWNEAVAPAIDDWNAEMKNVQIAKVMDSSLPVSSGTGSIPPRFRPPSSAIRLALASWRSPTIPIKAAPS
jgi:hypothetical protein